MTEADTTGVLLAWWQRWDMTGHTTLKDLQIQIFKRIGGMIQDLDDVEANRATTLNYMYPEDQPEDQVELAAFRAQPFQHGCPPFRPHGNNSRWVVAFNNLNDCLLPKPSKPTSSKNILAFLARHKYHKFANLHNSYFQIPIAKRD